MSVVLANLAWLTASLPGYAAFVLAARWPRRAQTRRLRRILGANRATEFGRAHGFGTIGGVEAYRRAVSPRDYEAFRPDVRRIGEGGAGLLTAEPARVLQPTSGSTGGSKWIPYTAALQREFRAALDPWMADLYLRHPSLLFGRQYWSISPNTRVDAADGAPSAVRLGFADDSEYLGPAARALSRLLFAVPSEVARIADARAFEYVTLLFLLRARNLRLISIWHPSFLTILLDALPGHSGALLDDIRRGGLRADLPVPSAVRAAWAQRLRADPRRADELAGLDPTDSGQWKRLWPRLRVISCWTEGTSAPWVARLRAAFPGAVIQPKGLVATEGIVSFPLGRAGAHACALRSHFLEFEDVEHPADVRGAWELTAGRRYAVLLTTGGGLYRYRLGDIVRVTGFYRRAPCLAFEGRAGASCDLAGEKLHAAQIEESLAAAAKRWNIRFGFAMVVPRPAREGLGYALYWRCEDGERPKPEALAAFLDARLCEANFHYRHARGLGQLAPLVVRPAPADAERRYRDRLVATGIKAGDVKLDRLRRDDDWDRVFNPGRS